MIEIRPNVIYSRADLLEMFSPAGVDWDALRARLQPRKWTAAGWLGSDLLDAMRKAPPLPSSMPAAKVVTATPTPVRRGRRPLPCPAFDEALAEVLGL